MLRIRFRRCFLRSHALRAGILRRGSKSTQKENHHNGCGNDTLFFHHCSSELGDKRYTPVGHAPIRRRKIKGKYYSNASILANRSGRGLVTCAVAETLETLQSVAGFQGGTNQSASVSKRMKVFSSRREGKYPTTRRGGKKQPWPISKCNPAR